MPVLTEEKLKQGGVVPPPRWPDDFNGDRGPDRRDFGSNFPLSKGQIGMWLLLTAVVMLFAGLSSAYVVLRGVPNWQNIAIPQLLWANTIILVASSFTLEGARSAVKNNNLTRVKLWIAASAALGVAFLAGQLIVWRQLVAAGVYLQSTLHSSFFYVLTGIHGVHLAGGVVGLSIVFFKAFREKLSPVDHEPLKVCALYWHFMDVIWIYLFLLLMLA